VILRLILLQGLEIMMFPACARLAFAGIALRRLTDLWIVAQFQNGY
jgi:hypothetical protein